MATASRESFEDVEDQIEFVSSVFRNDFVSRSLLRFDPIVEIPIAFVGIDYNRLTIARIVLLLI